MLTNLLLVFIGGGTGSVMRVLVGLLVTPRVSDDFPWSTFIVNLLGSFAIGALGELLFARLPSHDMARWLLIAGFLGGFTTFSAFSLESFHYLNRGAYLMCAIYILASILGTIALVFAGSSLMKYWT